MRIIWKGMRGITGLGLLISAISMALGGVILLFAARLILSASPGTTILALQSSAEGLQRACNRPQSSMPEYVDAPVYPLQLNCDTCADMTARAAVRTAIATVIAVGGTKMKGSKWGDKISKKLADFKQKVIGKLNGIFKSAEAKKAANSADNALNAGEQVVETAAEQVLKKHSDEVADAVRKGLDDKADDIADAAKGAAEKRFKKQVDEAADEQTKEFLESHKDELLQTYEKEIGKSMEKSTTKKITRETEDDILETAEESGELAETASKELANDVEYQLVKKAEAMEKNTAKCAFTTAAGFYRRGAVGTLARSTPFGTNRRGRACYASTATSMAWVGAAGASYSANVRLALKQTGSYLDMLDASKNHYKHIENVMISNGTLGNISGSHAAIAVSMDKDLLVGTGISGYSNFEELAKSSGNSRTIMWKNFIDTSDDLMYIFEALDDSEYSDYYFSITSDTRPSNVFIAGDGVALRPEHVETLEADFLELIRKRSRYTSDKDLENLDGIAYVYLNITEEFEALERYYEELDGAGIVPLDRFIEFLEDHGETINELSTWETDHETEQTASQIIAPIVERLKKIQARIRILSAEQANLNTIRDAAWGYLKGTECTESRVGENTVCLSDHSILMNCYWDDVREYAWLRGDEPNMGDCESMEVITNPVEIIDELGNKFRWDSIPGAPQTPEDSQMMAKVVTRSQNVGIVKGALRFALGMGGFGFGRAGGSIADLVYCEGSAGFNRLVCCIQDTSCVAGMCRICQKIDCARPVSIQPELQPSLLVMPNATITIRGNIGFLT